MGKILEKVRVTLDKDLDSAYQNMDKRFEEVRVTLDEDFNKFMKRVGFFQR